MLQFFPIYWRYFGLPCSRVKGWVVDLVPVSLVETLVWVGLLCLIFLLAMLWFGLGPWLKKHTRILIVLITCPLLLLLMGLGQGAFPWSLAPTAWRLPLAKSRNTPPLPYSTFQSIVHHHQNHLLDTFSPSAYESLSEAEILVGCNQSLDHVLSKLDLTQGRTVRRVKEMGPLTTLLGLSYGGPAFHDPFLGELAIVHSNDLPTPRYWRLLAVCHETAHAKGFTREMDAEILTQLALSTSVDARYRMLGDIMYLRKSGEKIHFPEYLRKEIIASRDSLKEVESQQTTVNFMRTMSRKLGFQNSGGKYGSRELAEHWDPKHPFFATVEAWLAEPQW